MHHCNCFYIRDWSKLELYVATSCIAIIWRKTPLHYRNTTLFEAYCSSSLVWAITGYTSNLHEEGNQRNILAKRSPNLGDESLPPLALHTSTREGGDRQWPRLRKWCHSLGGGGMHKCFLHVWKPFEKALQCRVMQNYHFGNSMETVADGAAARVGKGVAKFLAIAFNKRGKFEFLKDHR